MIHFFYGSDETYIDITDDVFNYCTYGDRVFIPANDIVRAFVFPDPLYGVVKNIVTFRQEGGTPTCKSYGGEANISIHLNEDEIREIGTSPRIDPPPASLAVDDKIAFIHSQLKFVGGSLNEEWNEQALAVRYLDPEAKVLEIGSNIGRNTLMIASLLNDDRNLVTLECDPNSVHWLEKNRFINKRHFHIEPSALSYRKLIQRGWDTTPADELPAGHHWVPTITFEELTSKYPIEFDTLVLDCEGAIYYILKDNPAILGNISTIIFESDFHSVEQKRWVEGVFRANGLEKIHSAPLIGNEHLPFPDECRSSFYEAWKKSDI